MSTYRIHAACPSAENSTAPYMTMEMSPDRIVRLDLSALTGTDGPIMNLPMASVYELLEGKGVDIAAKGAVVRLSPRGEDLIIDYSDGGNPEGRQWRVSLSEIAMAWNMLGGTPGQ